MDNHHDAEAIQRFFDGWDLYRRVIEHDYMFHRAIHGRLAEILRESRGRRVLDVGCGDASSIARVLPDLGILQYTGVDLSPVALESAATSLADSGATIRLVESDYLAFLEESARPEFDAIVAGYTVHHLNSQDLRRFFVGARRRLTGGGVLVVYDVIREEGEDLAEHIARNHAWRERTWTDLSKDDLAAIWDHVSTADFPKTERELGRCAAEAGFADTPDRIWEAPTGIHRLYAWR